MADKTFIYICLIIAIAAFIAAALVPGPVLQLPEECKDLEPPYASYDDYEASVAERIRRGC